MKFFFDARFIQPNHHDGISRFSAELFREISKKIEVVAIISDLRQLEQLPENSQYVLLNNPLNFVLEIGIAKRLNQLGADVVFSPMQLMGSFGRRYKLILTLHDLIYYQHRKPPHQLPVLVRVIWRLFHLSFLPQRLLLNRADAVVTVSKTSKQLIESNRLTKRPIHVVYNAATEEAEQEKPKQKMQRPSSNHLVYMGSFMEYKGVEILISAMNSLPGYRLRLLSKISDKRRLELLSLLDSNSGKSGEVHFLNGVSEEQYHQELLNAVALVSASKSEGFGIPIVEAMSRGVPVIATDIPIFREVGGQAATYFESSDIKAFVSRVLELEDSDRWSRMSALGLKQVGEFSWEKSADALLNVISDLQGLEGIAH